MIILSFGCTTIPRVATFLRYQLSFLNHALKPARMFCLYPSSFRLRTQTNGVIKRVWRVVGSRRILQIGSTPGFALEIPYIGPA